MMKTLLFSDTDWLSVSQNHGYGPLPIPHPRDDEIAELIAQWAALDAASRQEASAAIKETQRETLLADSERMPSFSSPGAECAHLAPPRGERQGEGLARTVRIFLRRAT